MKILTACIALLLTSLAFTQEDQGITLTIVFDNLVNDQDKVSAASYNETTFMRAAPSNLWRKKSQNKTLSLTLGNVLPGDYGLLTLHDFMKIGGCTLKQTGIPKNPTELQTTFFL